MVLGISIAIAVFVINYLAWNMIAPFPLGLILAFVVGLVLVIPIIVGFRILSRKKVVGNDNS